MQYKIAQLSANPPKEHKNSFGTTLYHKIRFEGSSDIVEIGRKLGNDPKVGDVLEGTIEDTQYGKKFKTANQQQGGGGKRDWVDHHEDIKIEWAIGQAIQMGMVNNALGAKEIEFQAEVLLKVFDNIKNPKTPAEKAMEPVVVPDDVAPVSGDEEIDLSTIPF